MRRGKPLSPVGRAARRDAGRRAEAVEETKRWAPPGVCQVAELWPEVRCWGGLEAHEVIQRSVMPSAKFDPSLMLMVCHGHNTAANDDPVGAEAAGVTWRAYEIAEARAFVAAVRMGGHVGARDRSTVGRAEGGGLMDDFGRQLGILMGGVLGGGLGFGVGAIVGAHWGVLTALGAATAVGVIGGVVGGFLGGRA